VGVYICGTKLINHMINMLKLLRKKLGQIKLFDISKQPHNTYTTEIVKEQ